LYERCVGSEFHYQLYTIWTMWYSPLGDHRALLTQGTVNPITPTPRDDDLFLCKFHHSHYHYWFSGSSSYFNKTL